FYLVTISRSDVALSTVLDAVDIKPAAFEWPEMTDDQLRQAIELPARVTGTRFETGLIERLIDDAHQAEQPLPLLQQMLNQMWAASGAGILTHAAYDRLGGLAGLQIAAAERYFNRLSDEERTFTRALMVRLAWAARTHAQVPPVRLSDLFMS